MSRRIVITAPAKLEIAKAVGKYEEQRPSAGVKFWIEFKQWPSGLKIFRSFIRVSAGEAFGKRPCVIIPMQFITELPETNCEYLELSMVQ